MNETDIAWAAGFVDGEGCITIRTRLRARNRRDYSVSLAVGQVDPKPLDKLVEMFGGSIGRRSAEPARRVMLMWRVTGHRAGHVLEVLRPYLLAKGDQADIAMEFLARVSSYGRKGRRVEDSETAARQDLMARITAAKWRSFE
ncbi:MAG: hypothetical protein IT345_10645 [Trueperaceae bacterium]|nr:hypothetical protein [Trueperaceae bacterium]